MKLDIQTGQWRLGSGPGGLGSDFRLLATGDICPSRGWKLDELFTQGPDAVRAVYGDILPMLADKDLSVANLELPLSDLGQPIIKDGPALQGPPAAIAGVAFGGFDVVDMANNHVKDYGPESMLETVELARRHGLGVVGVGRSLEEAWQPLFVERHGLRVGLLAVAENEFSNATPEEAGAGPLHLGPVCVRVSTARQQCDLLVVFIHGGNEFCPIASPRMVRDYRAIAESGADAVIGHHAHTVQGMEVHQGVPIIYNLGNFLFWAPASSEDALWWVGMIVRLHLSGRTCVGVDIHPTRMDPATGHASLLPPAQREGFFRRLNRLSEIQTDPQAHRRFWNAYCLFRLPHFLARIKETRDGMDNPKLRVVAAAHLKNLFCCEAHWEVISTGLELIRQGRENDFAAEREELISLCQSAT
ncbi:MAG: CapA family protein [Phycisphaeraceae bacterium]|nr:CapA family protein [Phycisphaeraceae bacterium]